MANDRPLPTKSSAKSPSHDGDTNHICRGVGRATSTYSLWRHTLVVAGGPSPVGRSVGGHNRRSEQAGEGSDFPFSSGASPMACEAVRNGVNECNRSGC